MSDAFEQRQKNEKLTAENARLKKENFRLDTDLRVLKCENGPIKPFLSQQLIDARNKLKKACQFILWVSPCGMGEINPEYKLIGVMARKCLEEINESN